jgi:hypothetical protein
MVTLLDFRTERAMGSKPRLFMVWAAKGFINMHGLCFTWRNCVMGSSWLWKQQLGECLEQDRRLANMEHSYPFSLRWQLINLSWTRSYTQEILHMYNKYETREGKIDGINHQHQPKAFLQMPMPWIFVRTLTSSSTTKCKKQRTRACGFIS